MNAHKLKSLMTQVTKKYVESLSFSTVFQATLTALSPLTFMRSDSIELSRSALIVPKRRRFTETDLGKSFVFMSNNEGQVFYYLYEASLPGENGEEFHLKGELVNARLKGTCTIGGETGTVEVTGGEFADVKVDSLI